MIDYRLAAWLVIFLSLQCTTIAQDFSFTKKEGLVIVYSKEGPKLDSITACLLSEDIRRVTGNQPRIINDETGATGNVIVIGNITSGLVQKFISKQSGIYKTLQGKWECFALKIIDHPVKNISKAFVITGSDARGTAYGVFTLSQKLGISPWYWWADVPVQQQKILTIHQPEYISTEPSVKYRGIFINDEDWGLQPWAAKTFEPETGDIGPKTYAKVFELLLRLKANLIWPAMHPCTKPFFHYPLNKKVAEDYAIVIGSSHAEPMLRNNVGEWDEQTMGHFNYLTNKEKVFQYWESRVNETKENEVIYTVGMRGIHDSGMEGVKNAKEAVPLLTGIISDQRGLLQKYRLTGAASIPQVFTAYKEVLDIYDNGLKIPDDITLVWPDDNYGYIQRLNNNAEQQRSGGAGVYYHASYWGRPHDYLWLSSTHPSLIREEMMKAYQTGATRLWVLNVGDIKPLEYNIGLFMDMAFDAKPFADSKYTKRHLENWLSDIFGKDFAQKTAGILWRYYQLAFERRPEFMGWSQTEPTTQTTLTRFNHFFYGDEAQKRIDCYEALEKEVKALRPKAGDTRAAAFYQLVYYPVVCASLMNKKFLYQDKAAWYARQNRLSAQDYASLSNAAYDSIVKETDYYNTRLAGGKWNYMMSMKPRELPVYQPPAIPAITIDGSAGWSIMPEGYVTQDSSILQEAGNMALPAFDDVNRQLYFVDVFLNDPKPVAWAAAVSHNWIRLSKSSGSLSGRWGKNQIRIWVDIDWTKAPVKEQLSGSINFKGNGKTMIVNVAGRRLYNAGLQNYKGFIENNGLVSIHANHFTRQTNKRVINWKVMNELGYTGKTLQALPLQTVNEAVSTDTAAIKKNNTYVEYDFFMFATAPVQVNIFTLPTHPLNNKYSMRYAVSIDNEPLKVVDFRTFGRSEEWKQNVLQNRAERQIQFPIVNKGPHTLKIYCVDPGVVLDEIRICLGRYIKAYSTVPETKFGVFPKK